MKCCSVSIVGSLVCRVKLSDSFFLLLFLSYIIILTYRHRTPKGLYTSVSFTWYKQTTRGDDKSPYELQINHRRDTK